MKYKGLQNAKIRIHLGKSQVQRKDGSWEMIHEKKFTTEHHGQVKEIILEILRGDVEKINLFCGAQNFDDLFDPKRFCYWDTALKKMMNVLNIPGSYMAFGRGKAQNTVLQFWRSVQAQFHNINFPENFSISKSNDNSGFSRFPVDHHKALNAIRTDIQREAQHSSNTRNDNSSIQTFDAFLDRIVRPALDVVIGAAVTDEEKKELKLLLNQQLSQIQ